MPLSPLTSSKILGSRESIYFSVQSWREIALLCEEPKHVLLFHTPLLAIFNFELLFSIV